MTFIRVKEEERNRKEKARKVPILNLDFLHQNRQVKKDMVIPGSDMIGTLILLMILRIQPQKELLRGTGVKHTAWMTSVPLEPCQPSNTRCSGSWLHTVNWIKSGNQKVPETCVVLWHHDRLFAVAISLLCLPTLRRRLVVKVVSFTFRQHFHVRPEWTCLKRVMCLSSRLFLKWTI